MTMAKKKPVKVFTKPYLNGGIFDENSLKNILKFFGMLVMFFLVGLIVSLMSGFGGSQVISVIFNTLVILLLLYISMTQGMRLGTEAVARGEILYQRKEKGEEMTENERKLSFHPAKGFIIGLLGSLPFLILAVVYACMARRVITSIGMLPSVANNMIHRSEIGDPLTPTYTELPASDAVDIMRPIVRACLMPVYQMADTDDKSLLLTLDRLSPLMILFPGIMYGIGYLLGKNERTRVHTRIEENRRLRKRRENRERRDRQGKGENRTPEQLN